MKIQPKLILSSLELEAFSNLLKASLDYYNRAVELVVNNEKYLTQVAEIHSKLIIIQKLHDDTIVNLQNVKYNYRYSLDLTHALQLLCSILPCDNIQFNVEVKNMVLAHCVDVLKYHQVIDDNVCFKPLLPYLEPKPFYNPSTTTLDYFEN